MSKKRRRNRRENVGAQPEIAHPDNKRAYEHQLAFIYAWFFEVHDRAAAGNKEAADIMRAARSARDELQALFRSHVSQLLRLALRKDDSQAKQWAGMILASIGVSVWKHDKKLREVNRAYENEAKKIGKLLRTDVLFPKPIGAAVKRELTMAERYRERLMRFKAVYGEEWRAGVARYNRESRHKVPEAYWPSAELPDFSQESEPEWWKLLWPLIKKNNPKLLQDLRDGRIPTRGILRHPRWASYRNEFRNALRTLAQLRSRGVL